MEQVALPERRDEQIVVSIIVVVAHRHTHPKH